MRSGAKRCPAQMHRREVLHDGAPRHAEHRPDLGHGMAGGEESADLLCATSWNDRFPRDGCRRGCLGPFCEPVLGAIRPDHSQESFAVLGQLAAADAVDREEAALGLREVGRHLGQRAVGKNHVGRQIDRVGQLAAEGAQAGEERIVVGHLSGNHFVSRFSIHEYLFPVQSRSAFRCDAHAAVAHILFQQALADELLGQVTPLSGGMLLSRTVLRHPVVAAAQHIGGAGAAEDVYDVGDAEHLSRALNAGKKYLRGGGGIHLRHFSPGRQAVVAATATVCPGGSPK